MAVSWRGSGGGAEDNIAAAVPCSIHGQMACDALTGETTRNERAGADEVHPKCVARRMRGPGRAAIDPTPRTRPRAPGPWMSPDVRRRLSSMRVKHVGRTAITSIRRRSGGLSGVAGRAWVSRDVGSWAVSSPWALGCGGAAWERALAAAQPELLPRAQGALWTCLDCTSRVAVAGM